MTYTVAEAKKRLPELIKQEEAGRRVVIAKRGVQVGEIVRAVRAVREARPKRVFAVLGNKKIVIDPNWSRPQEDMDGWLSGEV